MISSMTAFARQDNQYSYGTISWELRSVNHRYLEVFVRLPEDYRSLEAPVREIVAEKLNRGKVECVMHFKSSRTTDTDYQLNANIIGQLARLNAEITRSLPDARALSVADVLKWPGVLEIPLPDTEAFATDALALLRSALDELIDTRLREGAKLKQALDERATQMAAIVIELRKHMPQTLEWIRNRMLKRFEELNVQLDDNRLEQEMVILAQRTDVEEELKRLETHLDEVRRLLQGKDNKPMGRRLDFLMQELNREANTLCSKSMNAETTRAGVELKVLIEQMREQVQNIE